MEFFSPKHLARSLWTQLQQNSQRGKGMQKLTRTFALAGALAFAGVLAGCGDDVTVEDTLEVTVTPATATVAVGSSVTLTASVTGTNANKAVNWTTSDAAKATVDANGKVTGVAAGSATITATAAADPGVKGSALVTVSADKGVQKVEVSPANFILKVGEFVQATANVTRNPGVAGTVTWTSNAAAIATVDNTGKITAVSNGSAVITAASTVDPSVTGSMALTVRALTPAKISVQAVTKGGTTQPVNFNNIAGQIDVVLNVDPGDEVVTKVDVNIDGVSACSRNLSVAESDQLRLAAAFEELEAVDIVCSINTGGFNATTGAVNFANGAHTLSASGVVAGPPQRTISTSNQPATFNNQSGFIAIVSNTNSNTGFPANAINPTTGRKWVAGSVQLKLAAVNYAAGGAKVTNINAAFLGKTFADTPDAGTQIFTIDFPNSGTGALNLVGYQTAALTETMPVVTNANLDNGNQGATALLNQGASADSLGLPRLDSTRVDNVGPTLPAFTANPLWATSTTSFAAGQLGAPTTASTTDTGVDAVTATFWATAANGSFATPGACNLTGLTAITTGSQLAETIVNTAYKIRAVYRDALGNATCQDFANPMGADFTAPSGVTFAGVATGAGFTDGTVASTTNYTLATTGDNASGISSTTPALISLSRLNDDATATTTCVTGGTGCPMIAAAISGSITQGQTANGYYTLTAQLSDVAGNSTPTPAFSRVFVVDAAVPTFTGNIGLASSYTGNAPAAFTYTASDNLDLKEVYGTLLYTAAGVNLQYASVSLGSFGPALEKGGSQATYTIPSLIRCVNPAGSFGVNAAAQAADIRISVVDQAGGIGNKLSVGGLAPYITACEAPTNLTGTSAVNSFTLAAPNYGTGKTQVDIDGANLATASATSAVFSLVADVSLDNAPNPFSKVELYYQHPTTSNWIKFHEATAANLNQTVTQRTWTWTFSAFDPDASFPVGTVNVIAIGINSKGDAVVATPGAATPVTVLTVQ